MRFSKWNRIRNKFTPKNHSFLNLPFQEILFEFQIMKSISFQWSWNFDLLKTCERKEKTNLLNQLYDKLWSFVTFALKMSNVHDVTLSFFLQKFWTLWNVLATAVIWTFYTGQIDKSKIFDCVIKSLPSNHLVTQLFLEHFKGW